MFIIGGDRRRRGDGDRKIIFFWYLKRIGWLAAVGYFCGGVCVHASGIFTVELSNKAGEANEGNRDRHVLGPS